METNTTLYNHNWLWSPENEKKRKSLDELMECYYKSVGYGSVFLLNSTPDTSGLILEADRLLYKEFGDEIDRRFKTSVASIENLKGETFTLNLPERKRINHVVTMEDYRLGHRIREYKIEGYAHGNWEELCKGQSVGRKKIDYFNELEVTKIRLTVTKSVNEPVIRKLSAYYVELIYDGRVVLDNFTSVKGNEININRTAQVIDESKIKLRFTLKSRSESSGKVLFKPALIY